MVNGEWLTGEVRGTSGQGEDSLKGRVMQGQLHAATPNCTDFIN